MAQRPGVWLATKDVHDKKHSKSFKPGSQSEGDMEAAKALAADWIVTTEAEHNKVEWVRFLFFMGLYA